jgi:hypothetical protein
MSAPTRRSLLGLRDDLRWQRPTLVDPAAVDAVEVASVLDRGVLVRNTLGPGFAVSVTAWLDFLRAVKRGEFDGSVQS